MYEYNLIPKKRCYKISSTHTHTTTCDTRQHRLEFECQKKISSTGRAARDQTICADAHLRGFFSLLKLLTCMSYEATTTETATGGWATSSKKLEAHTLVVEHASSRGYVRDIFENCWGFIEMPSACLRVICDCVRPMIASHFVKCIERQLLKEASFSLIYWNRFEVAICDICSQVTRMSWDNTSTRDTCVRRQWEDDFKRWFE